MRKSLRKVSPHLARWGLTVSALLATTILFVGPVAARSIYLNGVKIDGVTNHEFKNATVTIDGTGNVHIEAKGYSVKQLGGDEGAAVPTSGPPVTETYWLVATETNPKKIQWDVDIFIGGKLVQSVKWDGGQVVKDISSFLVAGENQVHLRARRNLSVPRISFSPADKLNLIIGTGTKQGNSVVITKPEIEFSRSAAEDAPLDKDLKITAH